MTMIPGMTWAPPRRDPPDALLTDLDDLLGAGAISFAAVYGLNDQRFRAFAVEVARLAGSPKPAPRARRYL